MPTPASEFHGNRTPDLSYLRRLSNHSATSAVEGLIVRNKARGTNSRSIQFENPSNCIDVDFDTNNHEDTDHESAYHEGIIDTSLIPSTESKQPFDMEAPIPKISQFQLDLLNILSRHRTDCKVHDEIISLIKRHSNDQCLTFSSNNLKSRSSFLKDLKQNMDTAKLKP